MNNTNILRNYNKDTPQHDFYKRMHLIQTFESVKKKQTQYTNGIGMQMSMSDVLYKLDTVVDPSDPDTDATISIRAYQTAEHIRKKYGDSRKELQICGLIHDLGKILFSVKEIPEFIVGDTYVVGCAFPQTIVFPDTMIANPDTMNSKYSTPMGVYKTGCGITQLNISYGHNEFLYQVLSRNSHRHRLTERWADAIRFQSFYPWHTYGSYKEFMGEGDEEMLRDVLELNSHDLYSKHDPGFKLTYKIKSYYDKLLFDYFPLSLEW